MKAAGAKRRWKLPGRSIPFLAGLLTLLVLFAVKPTADRNLWALQYLRRTFGDTNAQAAMPAAPSGFSRGALWLAQDALDNDKPQKALDLIQPLISQNDPYALRLQVAALEAQRDFKQALPIAIHLGDFFLLNDLGNRAARADDQATALAAFEEALAIDPLDGTAPLATYLRDYRADLTGEVRVLRTALAAQTTASEKRTSQRLDWYHLLGDALVSQGSYDDAEEVYRSTLAEFPQDMEALIGLGWISYERDQNVRAAMDQFQQVIDLNPARGDGYFAMAQVLNNEKRFDEADPWYQKAIQWGQGNKWWWLDRANNARAGGRLNQALKMYEETARRFPDFAAVNYEMAWAYRLNKQPEQAQETIEKAISQTTPPNKLYYLRAAQIYEWSGENTLALQYYRKVLALDPSSSLAREGIDRLGGAQ